VAVTWGANSPQALVGSFDTIVHSVSSLGEVLFPEATADTKHILLDRDGVINEDVGPPGVLHKDEVKLIDGAAMSIHKLVEAGWRVSLVTNQNAVGVCVCVCVCACVCACVCVYRFLLVVVSSRPGNHVFYLKVPEMPLKALASVAVSAKNRSPPCPNITTTLRYRAHKSPPLHRWQGAKCVRRRGCVQS